MRQGLDMAAPMALQPGTLRFRNYRCYSQGFCDVNIFLSCRESDVLTLVKGIVP